MNKYSRVEVLYTAQVRVWQSATIPMPEPAYMLETSVRLGFRGRQYIVTSDERGQDMRVYAAYTPRRRPMRRCDTRRAIVAAVIRALPATAPRINGTVRA